MARKPKDADLNLDSLMDAVTNVVGVLMIVFIMVALNVARTVNKILSDLPPVTPEQLAEIQEKAKETPPPELTPEQIQKQREEAEEELKKVVEKLKTVDVSNIEQKFKFMDLDAYRKQLEDAKKQRDLAKVEVEKLLKEVERLKGLLDETPEYKPPPPTYVRMPNPRPYPEDSHETQIMVAKEGVIFLRKSDYLDPILSGLDKVKSQLEYKDPKFEHFALVLEKVLGSPEAAQKAWPEVGPLAESLQMDEVAGAYKALAAAGINPTKEMLTRLGNIGIVLRKTVNVVAEAVADAVKNDFTKWLALNPDPTKPTIKAVAQGNKVQFTYGSRVEEVRATPRDILDYFVKTLGDSDPFKNRTRDKLIYDAHRIKEVLERAAANPMITKSFAMKPVIRPGQTTMAMTLTPQAGAGESAEQIKNPGSGYQRLMREVKGDPKGVALFQVMTDAFITYLDARRITDDIGVPAAWEFLRALDITLVLPGYEVQRFDLPAVTTRGGGNAPIAPPKRTLD